MEKINPQIVQALKNGNHQAFQKIFVTYFKKIKYFIYSFIKSETDAEELAQEVFLKIWENHLNIEPDKSFDSYMFTITKNLIYNFLKHKLVEKSYQEYIYFSKSEFAHDPEKILYAKEIELLIEMTVSKMPGRRKEIYQLSRHENLSNGEIAEVLGLSKKTVENQLSLALSELKSVVTLFLWLFTLN